MENVFKRGLLLFLCDLAGILGAYLVAFRLAGGIWGFTYLKEPFFLFSLFLFPACFYIFDLYHPFKFFKTGYTLIDTAFGIAIGIAVLGIFSFWVHMPLISRNVFIWFAAGLYGCVFSTRKVYDYFFRSHFWDKKTLIVGTGPMAEEIAEAIRKTPNAGIEIVGFVAGEKGLAKKEIKGIPVVGHFEKLISLVSWHNIQLVVLALEEESKISEVELTQVLLKRSPSITSAICLFENLQEALPSHILSRHYLLNLMSEVRRLNYLKVKRLADISGAVLLLLLLSPVLFLAIFLLSFQGAKRIFYVQTRIGMNSRPFRIIKLRTMTEGREKEKKITRIGKWLRKYRIDEFPQLINVLKGDMSLIGPRPEIPYFVHKCQKMIPYYNVIFSIRPGLTGWAQVKYRHTTSDEDYRIKFGYNLYYLKNISLALDLETLLKTIRIILLGKGM